MYLKRFIKISILIAFLLAFSACERNDMYDFASSDIQLAYAFTDNGINTIFIETDGNGYYKETSVSSIPIANAPDALYAAGNGNFYAAKTGTVNAYYKSGDNSSGWTQFILPAPPTAIKGVASGVVLTDMWNDCIYSFKDGSLVSENISLLSRVYYPQPIASVPSKGEILIYGKSGGTGGVFNSNDPAVSLGLSTGPGDTGFHLYTADDDIFLGSDDYIYSLSKGVLNTVSLANSAKSYAIIDSNNIFAAVSSATLDIMKLEGTNFVLKKSIMATSGSMIIVPFNGSAILIGVFAAAPVEYNGLYKLDYASGVMLKISPRPIYSLSVKD